MKPSNALRLLPALLLLTSAWLTAQNPAAPAGPIPGCLEVPPPGDAPRAVGDAALVWPKNTLRVKFLGATDWQIEQVKRYAVDWEAPAGITFIWETTEHADIRVSFKRGGGSWSWVGTEAKNIEGDAPTMNLALFPETNEFYVKAAIRHEFGHALGLHHEHQNWKKQFTWKEDVVLASYAAAGWTNARTVNNVLESLNDPEGTLRATEFDPQSIMLYPIPAAHTNEGVSSGWNVELSDLDKKLIRELYRRDAR